MNIPCFYAFFILMLVDYSILFRLRDGAWKRNINILSCCGTVQRMYLSPQGGHQALRLMTCFDLAETDVYSMVLITIMGMSAMSMLPFI